MVTPPSIFAKEIGDDFVGGRVHGQPAQKKFLNVNQKEHSS